VCPQQTVTNGDFDPDRQARSSTGRNESSRLGTLMGSPLSDPPTVNSQQCLRCGSCVEACPTGARQWVGRTVTVVDLMTEVLRDRPFFEQSGGGVTFSGGEPLMQHEFLLACMQVCRQEGLHTALDTSGYAPQQQVMDLLELTDLFLYDLKLMDDDRHREHTGVSVQPILANLRALDQAEAEIWVRLPIIPGLNDDEDNVAAIGNFIADLSNTRRVHVLPFHEAGTNKKQRLGKRERESQSGSQPCVPLARLLQRLRLHGLEVHVGG